MRALPSLAPLGGPVGVGLHSRAAAAAGLAGTRHGRTRRGGKGGGAGWRHVQAEHVALTRVARHQRQRLRRDAALEAQLQAGRRDADVVELAAKRGLLLAVVLLVDAVVVVVTTAVVHRCRGRGRARRAGLLVGPNEESRRHRRHAVALEGVVAEVVHQHARRRQLDPRQPRQLLALALAVSRVVVVVVLGCRLQPHLVADQQLLRVGHREPLAVVAVGLGRGRSGADLLVRRLGQGAPLGADDRLDLVRRRTWVVALDLVDDLLVVEDVRLARGLGRLVLGAPRAVVPHELGLAVTQQLVLGVGRARGDPVEPVEKLGAARAGLARLDEDEAVLGVADASRRDLGVAKRRRAPVDVGVHLVRELERHVPQ